MPVVKMRAMNVAQIAYEACNVALQVLGHGMFPPWKDNPHSQQTEFLNLINRSIVRQGQGKDAETRWIASVGKDVDAQETCHAIIDALVRTLTHAGDYSNAVLVSDGDTVAAQTTTT